jgi:RNA polymerase sigma-70 factor (ECF subfamily)
VPYVFASVRNAAIEQAARRRKTVELNDSLFGDGEASPPAAIIACEQARLVRQTVDRLPLRQRQVVVLRAFGELTFHQIAEVLGEPLPTVASRYQRALRHMRETIEKGQERP